MTTETKTVPGRQITSYQEKANDVHSLLQQMKPQLEMALPKHLTADRLARVALTAIRKTPRLMGCTRESLAGAIMVAAQLGLEPDGVLGHFYLIPYRNGKTGKDECQGMIGYRGMVDLARRSGQISTIYATVVREDDAFDYQLGTEPKITHRPQMDTTKPVTHAYAVAKLTDGSTQFDVMSKDEVESIRSRSRAKDDGPWITDWDEMAKKTVVRRLYKMLPVSVEIHRAVLREELQERGIEATGDLIDFESVPPTLEAEQGNGSVHMPDDEPDLPAPQPKPEPKQQASEMLRAYIKGIGLTEQQACAYKGVKALSDIPADSQTMQELKAHAKELHEHANIVGSAQPTMPI